MTFECAYFILIKYKNNVYILVNTNYIKKAAPLIQFPLTCVGEACSGALTWTAATKACMAHTVYKLLVWLEPKSLEV